MYAACKLSVFNLSNYDANAKLLGQHANLQHSINLLKLYANKTDRLKALNEVTYNTILELADQTKHILNTYADHDATIHRDQIGTPSYQVDMEILAKHIQMIRLSQKIAKFDLTQSNRTKPPELPKETRIRDKLTF